MVREALIQIISTAIKELVENQVIDSTVNNISVEIEPPKQADHGDFATNFCLVASKTAKTNPRTLAETLLPAILSADLQISANSTLPSGEGLREGHELGATGETSVSLPRTGEGQGGVDETTNATDETSAPIKAILSAEIAGPGFINFKLNPAWAAQFLTEVLENPNDFYKPKNDRPQKINVEHVSVNPNGPITIGSGRGAAFGSALCNVLEAAGNTVHREYYINDGVNSEQMRLFAESVKAIIEGRPVPDNGYKGDYVHEIAMMIGRDGNIAEIDIALTRVSNKFRATYEIAMENWRTSMNIYGTEHPGSVLLESIATNASRAYHNFWHQKQKLRMDQTVHINSGLVCDPNSLEEIRKASELAMILRQEIALSLFQTNFDTWFSEQSLHDSGEVEKTLQHLIATGVADDQPIRTKVVMAKGGIIKEVLKEAQPTDVDDSDPTLPPGEGLREGTDEDDSDPTLPPGEGLREGQEVNSNLGGTGETSASLPPGEGQGGVDSTSGAPSRNSSENSNKTIWLRSTKFGDDQDRVLKRKDGRLTYIASDVAYHKDKFNRPANGDKLITVLGPDHHGYIARLTAVVAAMFSDQVEPLNNPEPLNEHEALIYDSIADRNQCQAALAWAKEHLEVQIFQLVRFLKDGKPAPMRKRDGNIYALIDLINEIGATLKPEGTEQEKQQAGSDVARFFYLMRHHDTAMDFDLELATKQSDENPVFYVQYAHARICSVIEKASEAFPPLDWNENEKMGGTGETSDSLPRTGEGQGGVDLALLQHPKELTLILKVLDLQNEVARTAEDYSVNRLTTYAIELARTYHSFYDSCRVIQPDQPELSQARLALCHATRIALQSALKLLGVSAPKRMDRTV